MRRDLAAVADLIESCFAPTLDAAGRSAIQEMRLMSRMGPLVWALARVTRAIPPVRGFVWYEAGRLVGNVSLTPAGYGRGWVIANVAVYPAFRRHGIAREMMRAAMERVARRGAFATLQVDADNRPARALYDRLGFREQRTFMRWRRATHYRLPEPPPDPPHLRRLARRDTNALVALAEGVRPNARGGMGWLRPTRRRDLRPPGLGGLRLLLSGQLVEFWGIPGADGELEAALRIERRLGGLTTLFDLLVRSPRQEALAAPLVAEVVRRWGGRQHPLVTDHPADDAAAEAAFEQHFFRPERTLVHLIWQPDGSA
jgi:ribosomal protein S18 acetylase RimI-like enzyme